MQHKNVRRRRPASISSPSRLPDQPGRYQRPAQSPTAGQPIWPLAVAAFCLLLLAGIAGGGVALVNWVESDSVFPGVLVWGVPVSEFERDQAIAALLDRAEGATILVEGGGYSQNHSPAELGLILDARRSFDRARAVGRSFSSLETLIREGGPADLEPTWRFDPEVAEATLEDLAAKIDRPAIEAGLTIENGIAQAHPAAAGRRLDVGATLESLAQNPGQLLAPGRLELNLVTVQPEISDMTAAVEAANRLLAHDLTVRLFDPISGQALDVAMPAADWGNWLSLGAADPTSGQLEWSLDQTALTGFLSGPAATLAPDGYLDAQESLTAVRGSIEGATPIAQVRIYHPERLYTIQPGDTLAAIGRATGVPYPYLQQANPDAAAGLFPGQVLTIPSPDELLPLPVVKDKRIVVSIGRQRVYVYENEGLKWDWPASTGIDDSPTAPGIFQIQSHEETAYASNWDLWMPKFMGVYRPAPAVDFMNGFHGFPSRSGHNLLWTGNLGRPVTYGCILISTENAALLFDWAEDGVVVEITEQ